MHPTISFDISRPSKADVFSLSGSVETAAAIAFCSNALARATRAREAFQTRLASCFQAHLDGTGPEPTDADLRTFALLAAAEHRLEQQLSEARADAQPQRRLS